MYVDLFSQKENMFKFKACVTTSGLLLIVLFITEDTTLENLHSNLSLKEQLEKRLKVFFHRLLVHIFASILSLAGSTLTHITDFIFK